MSGPGPELSDTVSEPFILTPEDATAGSAVYSVTVSCRSGCTGSDTTTVSFNVAGSGPPANSPPAVAISGPATVSIGTTTTFSASASDAETSASDLWHQWSILSAYAGVDFSEDETASSINVVVPNYEVAMMPISLNLEVCDEGGYFAPPDCTSATVVIEVIDANAFSVDAGSDVSAQPGDVVQLSGSVSGVTTGLLYQWSDPPMRWSAKPPATVSRCLLTPGAAIHSRSLHTTATAVILMTTYSSQCPGQYSLSTPALIRRQPQETR